MQQGRATAAEKLLQEEGTIAGESTSCRGVQLFCKKKELLPEEGDTVQRVRSYSRKGAR